MRESAEKAGMNMEHFCLVFEPEAASIFSKSLPLDRITGENNTFALKSFDVGKRFVVVDGGGGTVDISAQEVAENGELNVIHKACGGPFGGEYINQEYRKMLTRICGGDVLNDFKDKYIGDYMEMMKSFEIKKKTFNGSNVVVRLSVNLCDILSETTGCTFSEHVQEGSMRESLNIKRDKLFIKANVFRGFFSDSIKCVVNEIRNILENPKCGRIKTILMVGGFSESEIIRTALREAYPDKDIIIPQEGGLAVLKGAVLYGHNPSVVSSRTSKYTYGVAVMAPFKHGIHDPDKLVVVNEEELCNDIFHKFYTIDDMLAIGETHSIALTYDYQADDDDKRKEDGVVEIFVSDKENPMYVTDEGTSLHAAIYIPPPGGLWPPVSHGRVELEIGGTEMIGTYIDKITGARTSTKAAFPRKQQGVRKRLFDPDAVLFKTENDDS